MVYGTFAFTLKYLYTVNLFASRVGLGVLKSAELASGEFRALSAAATPRRSPAS